MTTIACVTEIDKLNFTEVKTQKKKNQESEKNHRWGENVCKSYLGENTCI